MSLFAYDVEIVNKGYVSESISDNAVIISMLILEVVLTTSSSNDAMNTSLFKIKMHAVKALIE